MPEVTVTGEGVTYGLPGIVDDEHDLSIELAGPEVCIYAGRDVPMRSTRHVRVVVRDSNAVLVRKLREALGYRVKVQGKAFPGGAQGRAGLVVFAERITIKGYPGDTRAGHAPIAQETYRAAARHCHSKEVIRMRPGVPNVFSVGGLIDRRTGKPSGADDAARIECVRQYLGIPQKDVRIVFS